MTDITKCPCGSDRFIVTETYTHDGHVNADGTLYYDSWPDSGGRDGIACAECEKTFDTSEFKAVEYT